jgi:hypothetical protein
LKFGEVLPITASSIALRSGAVHMFRVSDAFGHVAAQNRTEKVVEARVSCIFSSIFKFDSGITFMEYQFQEITSYPDRKGSLSGWSPGWNCYLSCPHDHFDEVMP